MLDLRILEIEYPQLLKDTSTIIDMSLDEPL